MSFRSYLLPRLAAAAAFSALLLGSSGAVAAAAATHPQLTDPAGDARNFPGINHPSIHILASDVSPAASLPIPTRPPTS